MTEPTRPDPAAPDSAASDAPISDTAPAPGAPPADSDGQAPTGPDRRWLMLARRPSRWSVFVPLVGVLAGVIFSMSSQTSRGTDLRSEITGLPDLILERERDNAQRAQEVSGIQAQVDRLAAAAAPDSAQLAQVTKRAEDLAGPAGSTPVRGQSLTVALNDSPLTSDQLPEWASVDDIVVHQQDVQAVVNALWRGGAEAMTIMDQRIIATSAVRCVGNTLILQGRVYSPPFVISAIGDPVALEAALAADPTLIRYQEYVAALGLGYAVERSGEKTFPAFVGALSPGLASPAS